MSGLVKQIYSLAMRGGLDTKTADAHVVPGKLSQLENAVFSKPGKLSKRHGFEGMPKGIVGGGTIEAGKILTTYKDELVLCDGDRLYSWSEASGKWVDKGSFSPATVSMEQVVRDAGSQTGADGAVHPSGLQVWVWKDSSTGVRYSVVDGATGQSIVHSRQLDADGIKPKCVLLGDKVFIVWVRTTDFTLCGAVLPVGNPTKTLATTVLTSTLADSTALNADYPTYDLCAAETDIGPRVYLAFSNRAAGDGKITLWAFRQEDLSTAVATAAINWSCKFGCTVFQDRFTRGPIVAAYDSTLDTVVYVHGRSSDLATFLGEGTIDAQMATNLPLCGVSLSDTETRLRVYWSRLPADETNETNYFTAYTEVVSGGAYLWSLSEQTVFLRSACLAGKAFMYGDRVLLPVVHNSTLQATYFLVDDSGHVVARWLPGEAGGLPAYTGVAGTGHGAPVLPETSSSGTDLYQMPAVVRGEVSSTTGADVAYRTGVAAITVDLTADEVSHVELGQGLHFSGSFPVLYDGVSPVEHGFFLAPEGVTAQTADTGGSLGLTISNAAYGWRVCYEWTDGQGLVHRSAPSTDVQATFDAGVTTGKATLTIPCLRITQKRSPRANVRAVVYRTTANGTVYYRVGEVESAPLQEIVQFVDTVADADVIAAAQLYVEGGVVENDMPPPLSHLAVYQNRVFGVDSQDPYRLWFSRQASNGSPVEFSDWFSLTVDPRGGKVTALAWMDDKLVIFKESSVFYLIGIGPDNTGAQSDFGTPQLLTTDCGCTNANSIVVVPDGLMFQSAKGIYQITRGGQAVYVGAEVERYNGYDVTSAVLVPGANRVQFTLEPESQTCLVYDYFVGQWSVFTPVRAADSCISGGLWHLLLADGSVRRETPGAFTDCGQPVRLKLATAWIQFAGVQGFQRVYKLLVLGEHASDYDLRVRVAYDHDPAWKQDVTVSAPTASTWGSDGTWGEDGTVWGGEFPTCQYRVFPNRQRCQAIRFCIEDVQTTENAGEGLSIASLAFEFGVRRGGWRPSPARQAG